jgi:hypothetical protein
MPKKSTKMPKSKKANTVGKMSTKGMGVKTKPHSAEKILGGKTSP